MDYYVKWNSIYVFGILQTSSIAACASVGDYLQQIGLVGVDLFLSQRDPLASQIDLVHAQPAPAQYFILKEIS